MLKRLSAMVVLTALSAQALAGRPIDVGHNKQLFIDDKLIASMDDTRLVVNPPAKAGMAFPQDKPWETGGVLGSTILKDGDLYRMYANVYEFTGPGTYGRARICYLESDDGITWRKPSLGQVEYDGSTDNNILDVPGGYVIIDPDAPANQRYKNLCIDGDMSDPDNCGMYFYYSADGIHWKERSERLFPFLPDGTNQILKDPVSGKYLVYLRQWFPRSAGDFYTSAIGPLRTVGLLEVDDPDKAWPYDTTVVPFLLWGEGMVPTPSAEMTTVISADHRDPPEANFYGGSIERYDEAPGVWLAFPTLYHQYPGKVNTVLDDGTRVQKDDGTFELQLAVSRDGRSWHRYRGAYIAPGHADTMDTSVGMYTSPGMVRNGNEIYQYYSGCDVPRSEYPMAPQWTRLYRTVQRVDGFVSVDADYEGGEVVTRPLVFSGSRLVLNVDNLGAGITRVELLDERGNAIPGFTIDDCDPIRGNHFAGAVSWNGQSDLSQFAGQTCRLRFVMRANKLYGFQFVAEGDGRQEPDRGE